MSGAPAALEVRELSIQFGGIKALSDVSFDVPPAGFTAVIGPNGAGKTTLFNCVSGFYQGSGSIKVDGRELQGSPRSQRCEAGVGRTFQTPTLIDDATCVENVMLGTYSQTTSGVLANFVGLPARRRDERLALEAADELIAGFGLDDIALRVAGGLPHRHRRLVEICRALASRPTLLLLDEPAAGSHHDEAQEMLEMVRSYCAERQIAVVLVEHNVRLVMQFARDVVVLNFGSLLARGTPSEIQSNPEVLNAYLGGEVA